MKLPKTEIIFSTTPESDSYANFAIECRRDISYINKLVAKGELNWGEIHGFKVIVMDDLAQSFKDKCRAVDNNRREALKAKTPQMRG